MNNSTQHAPRSPNTIDIQVGAHIRVRRKELKISQAKLGNMLGVTFQQIQKYERGTNRVGASRLWNMAQALEMPVQDFYAGVEGCGITKTTRDKTLINFINSNDGIEFAKALAPIPNLMRKPLLSLIRIQARQYQQAEA